jgi:hypothetical protein
VDLLLALWLSLFRREVRIAEGELHANRLAFPPRPAYGEKGPERSEANDFALDRIHLAKSFYIIDGHARIYRAYFSPFRDLTSPTGERIARRGLSTSAV